MPDKDAAEKAASYLEACVSEQDSYGGVVERVVTGMPAGVGDPVFDKAGCQPGQSHSVPSVRSRALRSGDGFDAASRCRSFRTTMPSVSTQTVLSPKRPTTPAVCLGGMSDGSHGHLPGSVKADTVHCCTLQQTVNKARRRRSQIHDQRTPRSDYRTARRGRGGVHGWALTVTDLLLSNLGARMEYLEKIYNV